MLESRLIHFIIKRRFNCLGLIRSYSHRHHMSSRKEMEFVVGFTIVNTYGRACKSFV